MTLVKSKPAPVPTSVAMSRVPALSEQPAYAELQVHLVRLMAERSEIEVRLREAQQKGASASAEALVDQLLAGNAPDNEEVYTEEQRRLDLQKSEELRLMIEGLSRRLDDRSRKLTSEVWRSVESEFVAGPFAEALRAAEALCRSLAKVQEFHQTLAVKGYLATEQHFPVNIATLLGGVCADLRDVKNHARACGVSLPPLG